MENNMEPRYWLVKDGSEILFAFWDEAGVFNWNISTKIYTCYSDNDKRLCRIIEDIIIQCRKENGEVAIEMAKSCCTNNGWTVSSEASMSVW
jgi:hypothetical protein